MFQRCLICTDFSDGLHRLVNFVPSLAASGIKCIVFFHSVPILQEGGITRVDQDSVEQAKQRLSTALEATPSGVEVKVEVLVGRPLDTIPRIVEAEQIDLIITGTPSRSLLEERIFGSTSMGLVKAVSTPLMILRPQLVSTYTQEELDLRCRHLWRYLLLPYNDSEAAQYLIEQIKDYAKHQSDRYLQQCMLCWVIDEGGRREIPVTHRLEAAKEKLAQVKADLEQCGLEVNAQVRHGNPFLELLDVALEFDISAIAVGGDDRAGLLEWTVPSLAKEILRSSWHPVIFLSQQK